MARFRDHGTFGMDPVPLTGAPGEQAEPAAWARRLRVERAQEVLLFEDWPGDVPGLLLELRERGLPVRMVPQLRNVLPLRSTLGEFMGWPAVLVGGEASAVRRGPGQRLGAIGTFVAIGLLWLVPWLLVSLARALGGRPITEEVRLRGDGGRLLVLRRLAGARRAASVARAAAGLVPGALDAGHRASGADRPLPVHRGRVDHSRRSLPGAPARGLGRPRRALERQLPRSGRSGRLEPGLPGELVGRGRFAYLLESVVWPEPIPWRHKVKTRQIVSRARACHSMATGALPRIAAGGAAAGILAVGVLLLGLAASPAVAGGTWRVFLYGNEVRGLAARGEEIWAATTGGLVRLRPDGTMSQWNRAAQGLLSDSVSTVAIDAAESVWAGTQTAGISVFEPQRTLWTPFTSLAAADPRRQDQRVRFAGPASAETLLVGAQQGYAVLVNGERARSAWRGSTSAACRAIRFMTSSTSGRELWIATEEGVVVQGRGRRLEPARRWPRVLPAPGALLVRTASIWPRCPLRGEPFGPGETTAGARPAARSLPSWFVPWDLLAAGDTLYAAGMGGVFQRVAGVWSPAGDISPFAPASRRHRTVTSLARTAAGRLYAGASHPQERLDGIWEHGGGRWVQHRLDGPSLLADYRSITFDDGGIALALVGQARRLPAHSRYRDGQWTLFRGNENGR